jgi:hypothetical protein
MMINPYSVTNIVYFWNKTKYFIIEQAVNNEILINCYFMKL